MSYTMEFAVLCAMGFAFLAISSTGQFISKDEVVKTASDFNPQELKFLGSVGSKLFFYDNGTARNWAAAGQFCKAANMELAAFETKPETDFVTDALRALEVTNPATYTYYWTSGTAIQGPQGYMWSTNGNQLSSDAGLTWSERFRNHMCVYLYIEKALYQIRNQLCSASLNAVVCQLQN